MELESSELVGFLNNLPDLDTDRLILDAYHIRSECGPEVG
jgi:hypothetical protein